VDLALATLGQGANRSGQGNGRINGGGQGDRTPTAVSHRNRQIHSNSATPALGPGASAVLRDRLVAELNELGSGDDAATWALRCLAEKNRLTTADAQLVEDAFAARLAAFATSVGDQAPRPPSAEQSVRPQRLKPDVGGNLLRSDHKQRSKTIDKSVLALPEPRRIRDRDHVQFVAKQPCLICGRQPSDAHHVRFAQSPALGRKVSDEFTVPLCRGHHREVHRFRDEADWWRTAGITPIVQARALWLQTHPLPMNRNESAGQDSGQRQQPTERGAISETWR
jgi:hypothetical protein